eukprot:SAG31_NODE_26204_length_446_cov_1.037464_1_plen_105_part_00
MGLLIGVINWDQLGLIEGLIEGLIGINWDDRLGRSIGINWGLIGISWDQLGLMRSSLEAKLRQFSPRMRELLPGASPAGDHLADLARRPPLARQQVLNLVCVMN